MKPADKVPRWSPYWIFVMATAAVLIVPAHLFYGIRSGLRDAAEEYWAWWKELRGTWT